jgi:hypothetical protein
MIRLFSEIHSSGFNFKGDPLLVRIGVLAGFLEGDGVFLDWKKEFFRLLVFMRISQKSI